MSTPLSSVVCHSCGANFGVRVKTCTRCGATMSELLLRPGDVIGDYEIVSLLGVGGMGEVFKVRHMELETFRTIKVMRKDLLTDEENRQRFLREARIAARVQHPNVAILHGFSRLPDGSYYMVSEFIDGITLRQWLESHPRFRPDVAIEIALQVLQGLEQCHRAGLLHRDISAVNIMIGAGSVEDAVVAKIIDMGIAKVVAGPSQGDGTRVGLFIGNPRYASPEQWGALEEDEQLDGRADLYCLGVVLYEMLTGKAPFHSKTALGYAPKHLAEAPPPFARAAPEADIPAELESVVMKALQKKRQDRWANAREFARALEPLRGDQRMGTMRLRLESISSKRSAGDFSPPPAVQPSVSPAPPVMVPPTTPSGLPEKPEAAPPASDTLREPSYAEKESAAWDAAVAEETEDAWIAYLDRFSESARAHEAEQRRDEARHFSALRPTDIAGLRAFLDRWPGGAHAEKARAALESAERAAGRALDAARDIASIDAFIREHRGSKFLAAAEQRREELLAAARAAEAAAALEEAERAAEQALGAARDIPALDAFLRDYPESKFRAIAEQRRQEWVIAAQAADTAAALERAERVAEEALDAARDVAALDAFLRDYRGSKFRAIAEGRREEWIAFDQAARLGSVEAWERFLAKWGDGDRHAEAQQNLEAARRHQQALEAAALRKAEEGDEADCTSFIDQFPRSAALPAIAKRIDSLRTARHYESALADGSERALQRFLTLHPRSDQASAVRAILEERDRFKKARAADTPQELRQFLLAHPDGQHAQAAIARLAELETAAYEKAARGDERATTLFLEQFPDSQGAAAIRAQLREDARLSTEAQRATAAGNFDAAAKHAEGITDPALHMKVLAQINHDAEKEIARIERELQVVSRLTKARKASELETLAQTAREPVAMRAREAAARIREDERRAIEAEEQAWTKATAAGTTTAWLLYLREHRGSSRAEAAGAAALSEADAYERAARRNRIADWKKFLARHPAGPHRGAAESSLAALEALRAQAQETETVVPRAAVPSSGRTRTALTIAAILLVSAIAAFALWKWGTTPPETPIATGALVIDARPWAEIVSIRDDAGKEWLPKSGETTPFHLELPAGSYDISLKGPDSRIAPLKAEIPVAGLRSVSFEFQRVDVDAYLKAAGW